MLVLTGSRALDKLIPQHAHRMDNADWDFLSDGDVAISTLALLPETKQDIFMHPAIGQWTWGSPYQMWRSVINPTLDELYTLKISHGYWNINNTWQKHAADIVTMYKHGAQFIPELHDLLQPVWEEKHGGKRKINLGKEAADFFNDKVVRVYDHDSIHHAVTRHERPLFERILKDGHTVAVDKAKWDLLPYELQLEMVREEVYATAIERFVLPSNYTYSPGRAYRWALMKTPTDFSKGWFAKFVLLNLHNLMTPDCDYVARFKSQTERLILL